MEKITLRMCPTMIAVDDGQAGRLWYTAPGLEIYVKGAVHNLRLNQVHYLACGEALARHIPLHSLRCVYRPTHKPQPISPNQKDMFK